MTKVRHSQTGEVKYGVGLFVTMSTVLESQFIYIYMELVGEVAGRTILGIEGD